MAAFPRGWSARLRRLGPPHLHRLRYAHRHATRENLGLVSLAVLCVALVVVGSLQLRPSAAGLPAQAAGRQTPVPAGSPPAPAPPAYVLPTLPALHPLIQATVLVSSRTPLSQAVVRRALTVSGARASFAVAVGAVGLGRGHTRALAADPVKARIWTPATTARATGVWQRAVIGEAVVAHAVAKADQIPLGATVAVQGSGHAQQMRVGAYATTQLPGIGLVVNQADGDRLGLVPGTGLLLSVAGADPAVVAAELTQALGAGFDVEPVLSSAVPSAGWVPPTIGRITSPFGMRIHPITHQPQFHEGIDIGAPLGTPVYAMSAGEVLYAGPASGFGNEIVLAHAGGVSTVYGHVSQIFVTGGSVKTGQVIALVGDEGESTGPHLHAEVHVDDVPVDPVKWLKEHGVRFTP
jgi:murein DD-endopeptidase MepM/ murein hydrolase activator NlpD